jgi:hypothetical protein
VTALALGYITAEHYAGGQLVFGALVDDNYRGRLTTTMLAG